MPVMLEQKPSCLEFANNLLNVRFTPENCRWISSLDDDGKLLGVVVLSRFTPWNCELSAAGVSHKFMTRAFIKAVFRYCFVDCGLRRITAVVEDGNILALEIDKRLGFVQEARLENWYGDIDGIVLRMKREECKWLREEICDTLKN